MTKERRNELERIFRNYMRNKEKLGELKDQLGARVLPAVNFEKVAVQTSPKNVLEDMLVKVIDEADDLCRLISVVDYTLIKYQGEYKDRLIKALYFKGWSINRTARELHIGRATVYRWQDEILLSAEMYAYSLGVLK